MSTNANDPLGVPSPPVTLELKKGPLNIPETLVSDNAALKSDAPESMPTPLTSRERPTLIEPHPSHYPVVPGYEILGELGRGGMGVVYKARQVKLNRLVALKMILHASHAGHSEFSRFRNEAEAFGKLNHPNIVQVHEVNEIQGAPYLVMELAVGGNLADRLHKNTMSLREIAQIMEALARAIHHAHERKIIHRDLKPPNILLQVEQEPLSQSRPNLERSETMIPKITDFGLAKNLDSTQNTASGALLGTVNYMAPEQAEGRTHDIGPWTDIYGLGAILYECLTRQPPFQGSTAPAVLLQISNSEPTPPSQHNKQVPRDLETICLKSLEKDPRKRYTSALEMAEDLQCYLAGDPLRHGRPVSSMERLRRRVKRYRREIAVLSLIGVLASALAIVLIVQALDRGRVRRQFAAAVAHIASFTEQVNDSTNRDWKTQLDELSQQYDLLRTPINREEMAYEGARKCAGLAEALLKRARNRDAEKAVETAEHLFIQLHKAHPNDDNYCNGLAEVAILYGRILRESEKHDEAKLKFEVAAKMLEPLAYGEKDEPSYLVTLAEVHHQWGELETRKQDWPAAESRFQKSRELRDQLVQRRQDPNLSLYQKDLARSHGYLGDVYLQMNQFAQADRAYRESERLRKFLWETTQNREFKFQLARSYENLARLKLVQGKKTEGQQAYQQAVEMWTSLVNLEPLAEYRSDLGRGLLVLAELDLENDDNPRAVALVQLQKAESLFAELVRESGVSGTSYSAYLARVRIELARCSLKSEPARAAQLLRSSLEELKNRPKPTADELVSRALALLLQAELEPKQSWNHCDDAVNKLRQAAEKGFRDPRRLREDAGFALLRQGEFAMRLNRLIADLQAPSE